MEEDVVQEYIAAMKYHIRYGLLDTKGLNKIVREVKKDLPQVKRKTQEKL